MLALLADSTNAERAGYTQTEQTVNNSLDSLFMRAEGKRIIVATFASCISRVQMIINCAVKYGRKGSPFRPQHAQRDGHCRRAGLPEHSGRRAHRPEPDQPVRSGTDCAHHNGSQGEPMSALTRMAFSDHRQVAINPNDFIIISARPIPGNERRWGLWWMNS